MINNNMNMSAVAPLYPGMTEYPQFRWAFIQKIYSIFTVQFLITVIACAVVVAVHPIADYLVMTTTGIKIFVVSLLLPFIIMNPMYFCRQKHPYNFFLLAFFTVSINLLVGLTCAFTTGRVVLEAANVTAAVAVGLTLYTFWAASRGHDCQFLGPFLLCSLAVLVCFAFIGIFFPFDKTTNMIFGILGTILFSGYIIYYTDELIKRYSYDEYIWASVSLHLDMLNLFLSLVKVLEREE